MPQVALVGAPNVGKSSLVQALSSGLPEVCDYPFTTRSVKMGHFYVDGRRHQVPLRLPPCCPPMLPKIGSACRLLQVSCRRSCSPTVSSFSCQNRLCLPQAVHLLQRMLVPAHLWDRG